MGDRPITFVARAPRGTFGRIVKVLFWLVALVPPLLMLGTCAGLGRFVVSEDPEVAMGAALFGASALGVLMTVWLLGAPLMGLLALLTRGKLLVIQGPPTGR